MSRLSKHTVDPNPVWAQTGSADTLTLYLRDYYTDDTTLPTNLTGKDIEILVRPSAHRHSSLHRNHLFSRVSSTPSDARVSVASPATNGIIYWQPRVIRYASVNATVKVVSDSTADTGIKVLVRGDVAPPSIGEVSEQITLNGVTAVAGTQSFGRVNEVTVIGPHAGIVSLKDASDNVLAVLPVNCFHCPDLYAPRGCGTFPFDAYVSVIDQSTGDRQVSPSGTPLTLRVHEWQ